MRTRLSIRILALGLLLWQLQATAVLGQKYYMNFAFNNNNPDGEGGEGSDALKGPPNGGGSAEGPASRGHSSEHEGSGDRASGDNSQQADKSDRDGSSDDRGNSGGSDAGSDAGSGAGSAGDRSAGSAGAGDSGDSRAGRVQNKDKSALLDQRVHDDDDSDSHDPVDRRQKEELALAKGGNKEHSHHSSYEISIDDSFGGRYVRSIYESSESHGHGASRAGSGRDNQENDSSESQQGNGQREFGDQDYEEPLEN
ncbi:accessory gland protein Acp32CD [Drosophila virilis]|uniref:accessory gland protein Acp32CD n=1 Tax=Drosophila virilis TaxID=7244 RepID=UPI00017D3ED9|nr:accessory gland protein Acp32CD [Drosophila virilis]